MFYYRFKKDEDRNCDIYLFTNKKIYEQIENDALKQLFDASKLPGAVRVVGMPDIHIGYGLPIGGVLAVEAEHGIVSPGAVGFDINCGVRLLTTQLTKDDIKNNIKNILNLFKSNIAAGLGQDSNFNFSRQEFKNIIEQGVPFLINTFNVGEKLDLENIEDRGFFPHANANKVSSKAIKRGITQLGSLGSGNHFVELQYVDKVFEEDTNLKEGQIAIMVHTGSRGFGHQIAKDYIDKAVQVNHKFDFTFPVKNLACFPIESKEGRDYLAAMGCAANFAYANRQLITHNIRNIFAEIYPNNSLNLFYDLTHNIARFEKHTIENKQKEYLIHRKGATRLDYNSYALLPGSMGTASYIIKSANSKSTNKSLNSIAHGSGRVMGRREAKRSISNQQHQDSIKNVEVTSSSGDSLLDESPLVYKNIEDVVESMIETKLAYPIVRLKPLAVLKG
ncbi:MAG TPA: RtcB family protein [Halanaerobiales bacterium]|nr:RtcB family protein [Halanaerobiales bacterium]